MTYALIFGTLDRPGYWCKVGTDIYLSCPRCGRVHVGPHVAPRFSAASLPPSKGSSTPAPHVHEAQGTQHQALPLAGQARLSCECGFDAAFTLLSRRGQQ